ncbi:unnamed protein product [Cuscuta epithymum]|uniref:Uncharacterized protein n=1 Tax=Cuscuta epithymum TaxID=186058 RepID=A0AAV0CWQ2_9ASTE|nr:unnamed protein product [Cuscuta epithymum]
MVHYLSQSSESYQLHGLKENGQVAAGLKQHCHNISYLHTLSSILASSSFLYISKPPISVGRNWEGSFFICQFKTKNFINRAANHFGMFGQCERLTLRLATNFSEQANMPQIYFVSSTNS